MAQITPNYKEFDYFEEAISYLTYRYIMDGDNQLEYINDFEEITDYFSDQGMDEEGYSVMLAGEPMSPEYIDMAEMKWGEIKPTLMDNIEETLKEELDEVHDMSLKEFEKNAINAIAQGLQRADAELEDRLAENIHFKQEDVDEFTETMGIILDRFKEDRE